MVGAVGSVQPADSTYSYITTKVRRLTASGSQSALSNDDIDQYVNNFYNNDFPYAIKIDQTRSVYTIFTTPNVDRYPLDVNNNQGIRGPVYFEGLQGYLFKDRGQFFNMWPRFPTEFQVPPGSPTYSGTIDFIGQSTNGAVLAPGSNLPDGTVVTITGVSGMTQVNGQTYTIGNIPFSPDSFLLNVDTTGFSPYTRGTKGTFATNDQKYSFQFSYFPILSTTVCIGGTDVNGNVIRITDDGGQLSPTGNLTTTGNLLLLNSNTVGNFTPPIPDTSPIQIADTNPNVIGTVNYVTGEFDFTLDTPIMPGTQLTAWASQYVPGRSYCILFWNNEFTVRPVPQKVYKIEMETYLTPTQFLLTSDNPKLKQWAQYIAYGAAMEILRDRQDIEGVENLREGMMRQESLVLERQSVEEIFTPNYQLFNSTYNVGSYALGTSWGGF